MARLGWAPAFIGVWGDTNMPVVDSWLYEKAFRKKEFGTGLYLQPPALLESGAVNPRAENLRNLAKIPIDREKFSHYYAWQASTMEEYDIDRLLKLKKGFDRRGKPVHGNFDRTCHVIGGLKADPYAPLIVGIDTGATLKHAALFGQATRYGHANILAEISPRDRQCSIEQFAEELIQVRNTRFASVRDIVLVIDPSATAKMAVQGSADRLITYAQYLELLTGFDTELAQTNDPGSRRSGLDTMLRQKSGLFIDEDTCPDLIAALEGGYCFRRIGKVLSPEVIKNDYSHLGEAAEYFAMKLNGPIGLSSHSDRSPNVPQDEQPTCAGY